jgi:hypothetical protein
MPKSVPVSYRQTVIDGEFWQYKQEMVRQTTLPLIYQRFVASGRFPVFEFDWNPDKPYKPHQFYDSDVAKWMESAAYLLAKKDDPEMRAICEHVVDVIEKHQDENGYFNSYFMQVAPDMRFKNRNDHELYCAGHLMEAAVAYYEATGQKRMLKLMEKYALYIKKVFIEEKSAAFMTPGHEEIELALVKMYRATGNMEYLEMSKYFIDTRGNGIEPNTSERRTASFSQSHLPVRQQKTAEGHSVRAVYLYCAMADLAYELGDNELLEACRTLLNNIAERRMYITGGIGQAQEGETFTIDYDLQNVSAYTETCATLGLALFCRRMSLLEPNGIYADIAEKCLYNGFLSGVSLDGTKFFYENPLEIHPYLFNRHKSVIPPPRMPMTQRQELYPTSCCLPNLTRVIASIANFLYTRNEDTLYVHQYMNASTELENGSIKQKTAYPSDGGIKLNVTGNFKRAALRIPSWCEKYSLKLNGKSVRPTIQNGYAYLDLTASENIVELNLEMQPFWVECNPHVYDSASKVALQRGPIIYCMEGIDNGEYLSDIKVYPDKLLTEIPTVYGIPNIAAFGNRRRGQGFETLYRRYKPDREECSLLFVPYHTFANRGETEMIVWVKT